MNKIMAAFKVITDNGSTFISNKSAGLLIKVEQDRILTADCIGATIETTLYREVSTFEPVCNYVFEMVDGQHNPISGDIDLELFYAAIRFFFNTVLKTAWFVRWIPKLSSLYSQPVYLEEAVHAI
jgi:hypothetical protein